MKTGIRFKLVTAFVLVIIVPLLALAAAFFSKGIIFRGPAFTSDASREGEIRRNIVSLVEDHYGRIDDHAYILDLISGQIGLYQGRLVVTDRSGILRFDSDPKANELYAKTSYSFLIIHNKKVVADAVFSYDASYLRKVYESRTNIYVVVMVASCLVAFIGMIIFLTWSISKSILVPLKKLNTAAESISSGQLDVALDYRSDDELGHFCQNFDQMRLKLKNSLEEQAAIENSRKELVASISHDLRTPITSIKGYVEGLQDGMAKDKDKLEKYLSVIKNKTMKLDEMIDALFQFSQLDLGKLSMDMEEVDAKALLEELLIPCMEDFVDSGITLDLVQPFPSAKVRVDRKRILQVFDNLLQNSRRYVDSGGRICISAVLESDCLKITVEDTGIGIAETDLPKVFDMFYRSEKSRSREFGGAGLGLAICKRIVTEHHGRIWAESVYGKGTSIIFTLPLQQ